MNLKRTIRNFFTDIRVGGRFLGGGINTRYASSGANKTSNSQYEMLDAIFDYIEKSGGVTPEDVFVDVGCGKGRVLNYWILRYPRNKKYGIELDPDIAETTAKRLRKYKNCEVISGDAIEKLPEDGTIFFLFNPFQANVMRKFERKMRDVSIYNKALRIIYLNCYHLDCFDKANWSIVKVYRDKVHLYETALLTTKTENL